MFEIRTPKTLRQFGYEPTKANALRRSALIRATTIVGNSSVLFNLSTGLMLTKTANQQKEHHVYSKDILWLLKAGKIRF